jgi:putative FmdB family regulatory protein
MPIYEYRCTACGHQKDHLQKMSDAPLTTCPACGAETYTKQISAAGFQLKGSGWYATDFKGGSSSAGSASPKTEAAKADTPASTPCGGSCACH